MPIVVSGGIQALTVPWYLKPITNRLNPVLIIGTEYMLKSGNHVQLIQTGNLGFFQHYWWMTGVFIDSEFGVRFAIPLGLYIDTRLGIGYMHYFLRRKSLKLQDGQYVQVRDWGKPSLLVPLSIVFGYRGHSASPLSVSPFVSVQCAVQALFTDEISAVTHVFLSAGVCISIKQFFQAERR